MSLFINTELISPLARYQRRVADGELRADRAQVAALKHLNALHRALCAPKFNWFAPRFGNWFGWRARTHGGIYLWGGVGSGKTILLDLFYQSLPRGLGARMHYHKFMQSVFDEKHRIRERADPLAIIAAQLAARARVLCIDEFAVTDITDAMIWAGLLQQLFTRGVAIAVTSNTRPDDLYQDGLQRRRFLPAIELIKTRVKVTRVDRGVDYRMNYLVAAALYHTPHDAHANTALAKSFAQLENDWNGARGQRITLCGREVITVACGQGAVWFEFAAICATHRTKMDYIEIAKRFHTVIIADIPVLNADADNAARRLIELIDELYDRGVNLIVSAARNADELYCGSRLREPFQRTASRLREMASRDYLARPHLI